MRISFFYTVLCLVVAGSRESVKQPVSVQQEEPSDVVFADTYCTYLGREHLMFDDVNEGLQNYAFQCINFRRYVVCLVTEKKKYLYSLINKISSNIYVPIYEVLFPSPKDIQYAGTLFCGSVLRDVILKFPVHYNMSSCRPDPKICRDRWLRTKDIEELQKAVVEVNNTRAAYLSCRVLAPYTACMKTLFVACKQSYAPILDFEIAKLGSKCLESYNIVANLITKSSCEQSRFPWGQAMRASGQATGPVPSVWICCSLLFVAYVSIHCLKGFCVTGDAFRRFELIH